MNRTYLRGHPLIWSEEKKQWLYADNLDPIPANGGKLRPCKKCGAICELWESDPCLGDLPGVDNACCGHGIRSESYIRFTNGIVIKDFIVEKEKQRSCCKTQEATNDG